MVNVVEIRPGTFEAATLSDIVYRPDYDIILLYPGEYDVSAPLTSRRRSTSIAVIGLGSVCLNRVGGGLPNGRDMRGSSFLQMAGGPPFQPPDVRLENICFVGWRDALFLYGPTSGSTGTVRIHNCRFFGGNSGIRGDVEHGLLDVSYPVDDNYRLRLPTWPGVSRVSVTNCDFGDLAAGIDLRTTFDHVRIEGCRFLDIDRAAVTLGSGRTSYTRYRRLGIEITYPPPEDSSSEPELAEPTLETRWRRSVIKGNEFRRIGVAEGDDGDVFADGRVVTAERHAIIVFGEEAIITHNMVGEVLPVGGDNEPEETGLEGIYTKASRVIIAHNVLVDAGFKEGAIVLKGTSRRRDAISEDGLAPRSLCNLIYGNTVVQTPSNPLSANGIVVITDNNVIAGNTVVGCRGVGISCGTHGSGRRFREGNRVASHNLVSGCMTGIRAYGAGTNIVAAGNLVTLGEMGTVGIQLEVDGFSAARFADWPNTLYWPRANFVVTRNEVRGTGAASSVAINFHTIPSNNPPRVVNGISVSQNAVADVDIGIFVEALKIENLEFDSQIRVFENAIAAVRMFVFSPERQFLTSQSIQTTVAWSA